MRHLFIMNPHAGKYDRSQEMLEKVRTIMAGRRAEWSAARTEGPGHAIRLVEEAARQGDPLRVYACGGDGTLNEVVNGAAGLEHVAVTHCPMGSGNDFLRIFGQDAGRFWHLDQLLDGPQVPMDLIDCNGRYSLNVCSVGFDARIGFGAADFKKLPLVSGSTAYQLSALRTIIRGIHLPYQVEIDGEAMPGDRFTLLCACNGRYYGRIQPQPDGYAGRRDFGLYRHTGGVPVYGSGTHQKVCPGRNRRDPSGHSAAGQGDEGDLRPADPGERGRGIGGRDKSVHWPF